MVLGTTGGLYTIGRQLMLLFAVSTEEESLMQFAWYAGN